MIERDILLVGGGLANGLIAYRLREQRPELRIVMFDPRPPGTDRTWSFHESDLSESQRGWLAPFIAHRWPSQEVRFPNVKRRLASPYATVSGDRFREILERDPRLEIVRTGARSMSAQQVETTDGAVYAAPLVIDGTGHRSSASFRCGWQKFLGLELELKAPSRLQNPLLMDATVAQTDGFRFVYCLPLAPHRILVEDTYYSASPDIDRPALRDGVLRYAAAAGWSVGDVLRTESGALPIPLSGDIDWFWRREDDVPARSGMAAGLFHMVTGYSLPDAVRLADELAAFNPLTSETVAALVETRSRRHWRDQAFYRMLNRMLFCAARPDQRWRVMERFYRLPRPLIERFYAGRTNGLDKLRLLAGRPPVPVGRALSCLPERHAGTVQPAGNAMAMWGKK